MRQLHQPDINGAPLLLLAAGNPTCFEILVKQVRDVIGDGGITEQARCLDLDGKNITMYAARGRTAIAYEHAKSVLKTSIKQLKQLRQPKKVHASSSLNPSGRRESIEYADSSASSKAAGGRQGIEQVDSSSSSKAAGGQEGIVLPPYDRDRQGRTVLHHAAEAGSIETLQKVLEESKSPERERSQGQSTKSPLMCLLESPEKCNDDNIFREKVNILLAKYFPNKEAKINHLYEEKTLEHAARGGLRAINLVQETIQNLNESDSSPLDGGGELDLENLLQGAINKNVIEEGKDDERHNCERSLHQMRSSGIPKRYFGQNQFHIFFRRFFYQAARGGHKELLESIRKVYESNQVRGE